MNYAGFSRPVWTWLRGDVEIPYFELPVADAASRRRRIGGDDACVPRRRPVAIRRCTPGRSSTATTRLGFRTMAGSRDRQLVGIGLQMTMPGVPMVFAGDELGLEGEWGEDARRTMPWDSTGRLGHRAARRVSPADRLATLQARARPRRYPLRVRGRRRHRLHARDGWRAPPLSRQPGRAHAGAAAALRTGSSGSWRVSTEPTRSSKATTQYSRGRARHSMSGG